MLQLKNKDDKVHDFPYVHLTIASMNKPISQTIISIK